MMQSKIADITCTWTEDDDGVWYSSCGEVSVFNVDGPYENRYSFCPYCGKWLLAVPFASNRGDGGADELARVTSRHQVASVAQDQEGVSS